MKKLISMLLALAMVMSLSVTAFAAEEGVGDGGSTTIDISATYKAGDAADPVVSVDISWGAMSFTYTDGADGKWDPKTHTYGAKGQGTWTESGNEITLTNHSNVGIKAEFTYTPSVTTVTGSFTNNGVLTLDTADNGVDGAAGTATTGSLYLNLGGTMTADDAGQVGTVTIKISKN